jgi:hypothetical protein
MTHAKTKAACSSVPLDPLVGQLVLDIGCPLTQEMRRFNPDGFPEIEGVVVAVFDWGVRLADPMDMVDEWDCETGHFVVPNG